jgi:hypothetical protein
MASATILAGDWPLASMVASAGDFTCQVLDASGAWVPSLNGLTIPQFTTSGKIGVKASCQLTAIILSASFKMRFTFISPSGVETVIESDESYPVEGNPIFAESKTLDVSEIGAWQCKVEVRRRKLFMSDWEVTDTWGPFYIGEVVEPGGDGDDGGGLNLTDTQKALLIAAGVGVAAIALMKKE